MSKTIIVPEGKTLSCNLGYKWHGPQELGPSRNPKLVYNETYTDGTPVIYKEERATMFSAEPVLEPKTFYSELSPKFEPQTPLDKQERSKERPEKKLPEEPVESEVSDE